MVLQRSGFLQVPDPSELAGATISRALQRLCFAGGPAAGAADVLTADNSSRQDGLPSGESTMLGLRRRLPQLSDASTYTRS
mmetsp:Transcript_2803/g.7127  ORF Transcript_2803/g.7127 Transcript_2803/m.7127 type:complete len:81 (-) Transcript_2803:2823-3065(-)